MSAASGHFLDPSEELSCKYHRHTENLACGARSFWKKEKFLQNGDKENGCLSSHMVWEVVGHDIGEVKDVKVASA